MKICENGKMPTMLDYAPFHVIFDFLGKNDNVNELFRKKDIYQVKKLPDIDSSIPPTTSTLTVKNC